MGSAWTEWRADGATDEQKSNIALQTEENIISALDHHWWWEMDLLWKMERQELVGWSQQTFDILFKTKFFQTENGAVRLLGSTGCRVLWVLKPGETVYVHHYHEQVMKLNSASLGKKAELPAEHLKVIIFITARHIARGNSSRATWRRSTGKLYHVSLTLRT